MPTWNELFEDSKSFIDCKGTQEGNEIYLASTTVPKSDEEDKTRTFLPINTLADDPKTARIYLHNP